MHILFLTDNFPPEVNAPASRTFEHCREWARAGHQITVITCVPNFPKGEIYPGYQNRIFQTERMEGIRVIRVWSYITANEGFIKRILDYSSFMAAAVLASAFVKSPDIIIGTSPHFFTACGAFLASRIKGVPFVFELRDLWPESIKAVGAMRDSLVIRLLERIEMFLYRHAAMIVSVTHSFKRILIRRGIEADKIKVVMNGADLSRFRPMPKDPELSERYGLKDKFVVGYVGTHGMAHALDTILIAAKRAADTNSDDYRFVFLGDGARKEALKSQATCMGLRNVIFLDSVPKAEVARYWSLLDAAVIHLRRTPLFRTVIPSKLFECMGMGIPVLHGVAGESAEIVEKEGVGLIFAPEDADELYAQLLRMKNDSSLYDRLKHSCLNAVDRYNRTAFAGLMLQLLQSK